MTAAPQHEPASPVATGTDFLPGQAVTVASPEDVDEPEKGPLRRCMVTRESLSKEAMIRFVLDPERVVVPDLAGRLPGRGMWLSASTDVLERALKRGAFARAARGMVQLPPDLRLQIEDGLKRRLRDLVGFARRGGQAVCGREAVREWMQSGKAGLLVEASDGSPNERARLVGNRGFPVVTPLPADMLGGIFGRDHAVHVAIASGRLAKAIQVEATRLDGMSEVATPPAAAARRKGPPKGGPD